MEQHEETTLNVIVERLSDIGASLRDLVELQKNATVDVRRRIEALERAVREPGPLPASLFDRLEANEQAVAQMMEAVEEYSGQVVRLLTGKPKAPPAGIPHDDPMDGE